MSMETSGLSNDEIARQELTELAERLDERTEAMSDGFEHLEDFQAVLQYGEQALPVLLERMRREEGGEWWEMQAVCTIAEQYGQPIEGTEGVQLGHDEAKALIVDWGKDQGYIPREDPETEH
jgi:predicted membrane GTPase involved in stress response